MRLTKEYLRFHIRNNTHAGVEGVNRLIKQILENQEIIEDIRILVYLHDGSDTNAVERFYNIKGILGEKE